jgi:predicted AAA+ superfamily ATPase
MLANRAGVYVNWDIDEHRKRLVRQPAFFEAEAAGSQARPALVVFDELHKYARWKNYLKGVFDGYGDRYAFLVTGSGRLDIYKRGGDSLLGRYVPIQLFPLSVAELGRSGPRNTWAGFIAELAEIAPEAPDVRQTFESLLRFGGFPEPLLRAEDAFYRVWSAGRTERLIREDIRDATNLRDLSLLQTLAILLIDRVGSPLSTNSLREDLGVAFETVRSWIGVLDAFFYSFRIAPWSTRIARAIRKEAKLYLWDWAEIADEGARFENLVALHLLKAVRTWSAVGDAKLGLHYIRDKQKREVDFVITDANRPVVLVECKRADTTLSADLLAFQAQLDAPYAVQLVQEKGVARRMTVGGRDQWIVSADRWLGKLL